MLTSDGDAGWMDLGEARVREDRAALVRAPDCRRVRSLRVGREIVNVAVTACGENDCFTGMGLDCSGHQVASDDPPRLAIDDDEIEHLCAGKHLHAAASDLALESLIRAKK